MPPPTRARSPGSGSSVAEPGPPRWHLYPIGGLATTAGAIGFTLVSLPLMALLLIPVFLLVQYLAAEGIFGVGGSGAAWQHWANLGVWTALLLLAVGSFLTALVNLAATALTAADLRQAPRRGGGPQKVPHPDQWTIVSSWTGMGLLLSGVFLTAVLALAESFPPEWQQVLGAVAVLQWPRVIGFGVIAIALAGLYRPRHERAMRVLQRAWPAAVREGVETAGRRHLQQQTQPEEQPGTADGTADGAAEEDMGAQVLLAHSTRRTLTMVSWRMHLMGLVLLGLAVLAAAILLPIGAALAGRGPAAGHQVLFLSPLVLVVSAGVLLTAGAVLATLDETMQTRQMLTRVRSGQPVEVGVLARVGVTSAVPGVNLLGLLGAVAVVLGVPAWIGSADGLEAGALGAGATVAGAAVMLAAIVIDVLVRARTSEDRNTVFARWPMPGATAQAQPVPDALARRLGKLRRR